MRSIVRMLTLAAVVAFPHADLGAMPNTVSYQGQLESGGAPFDGTAGFKFALWCGSGVVWSNDGTSVNGSQPGRTVGIEVRGGVFSVLLGDPALGMLPIPTDPLSNCTEPRLRVWVDLGSGFEQLEDQPLASAPFALQSMNAERAPDGFVVTGRLEVRNITGETVVLTDAISGQVSLNSIRFPDGSVQTTAAATGPVSDGDWTVENGDMYAAVPGDVGIGTSSPAYKLHVQTPLGEAVRLGMKTGGSWSLVLEQSPESVFSITNGGQQRLVIRPNGNVGIGTTTPGRTLDVVGTARVQGSLDVTGGLTVDGRTVGSGTHMIPASAFVPERNTLNFIRDYQRFGAADPSTFVSAYAPVMLPDGAAIADIAFVVTDSDATRQITIGLMRSPIAGGNPETIVNRTSATQSGRQTLSDRISHVIDNTNYTYNVFTTWSSGSSPSALSVHAVRIRYASAP